MLEFHLHTYQYHRFTHAFNRKKNSISLTQENQSFLQTKEFEVTFSQESYFLSHLFYFGDAKKKTSS